MTTENMRAVVLKGVKQVAIEQRPIPTIQDDKDIIVKVKYTALCGSELHVFRGHQPSKTEFIMGHEFTGVVTQTGAAVTTVKAGDAVVCPFTVNCGECFYYGAQAEYVRVPLADATAVKAPPGIEDAKLCLMADIFPTGYFAANNAFGGTSITGDASDTVVVLIGCGPVGLCALIATLEYKPKALLAVDGVPDRLATAKELGAEPWNYLTEKEALYSRVKELTGGRGADVVVEVVGHSSALEMGFDLLRPWGTISSVGVHNGPIPWTGNQAYNKNLSIKMGRCPARTIFPQALELLEKKQHLLNFMTDTIMPLSDAVAGYELFDNMKAHKVIFDAEK